MANDCRGPQTNAGINGVNVSNGGRVNARNTIDNSRNKKLILNQYNFYIRKTYSRKKASQLAHHNIADFVTQIASAGSSDEEIALQTQDTAALEDNANDLNALAQSQLHLDDLVNASAQFEMLKGHEDDYERCKDGFLHDMNVPVPFPERMYTECKEAHQDSIQAALTEWLEASTDSTILAIDGSEYSHKRHWATRFAVEAINDAVERAQPVCHHFCGERPSDVGPWPSLVVRHLLAQLPAPQDVTGVATNGNADGTRGMFYSEDPDVASLSASILWVAFGDRMAKARMDSVTIVLDRIDALYGQCRSDDRAMKRFDDFVDGLALLMRSGPRVRVMLTSWSSEPLEEVLSGVLTEPAVDQKAAKTHPMSLHGQRYPCYWTELWAEDSLAERLIKERHERRLGAFNQIFGSGDSYDSQAGGGASKE